MKRFIIIFIVFSLLISLCSCSTDNSGIYNKGASKSKAKIQLFYPDYKQFIPKDERIDTWEQYMSSKYGREIELKYLARRDSGDIGFDDLLRISEGSGLVIIKNYDDLTELINKDMIQPVNYLVDSIQNYGNIDEGMIHSLKDSFGNLWGIPLRKGQPAIRQRAYNKDWLDSFGMTAPQTIEEFYDFAEYVALGDPDGNGKNDTYVAEYTDEFFFFDFSDVFKAFGCYPRFSNPVGYNPHNLDFENFILEGNFVEAMQFMKNLKDKGYIINKETADEEYMIASSMYSLSKDYINSRAYGPFLKGVNETMLMEVTYPGQFLVVLKDTDNPQKMIEAFLDVVYSSTDSYFDFAFGIKGEDYFDMGDHYKVDLDYNDPSYSSLIGIKVDLNAKSFASKPIVNESSNRSFSDVKESMAKTLRDKAAREEAYRYLGTNMAYMVSFDTYDYETRNLVQATAMMELIFDIMENDAVIEDAVVKYRRVVRH